MYQPDRLPFTCFPHTCEMVAPVAFVALLYVCGMVLWSSLVMLATETASPLLSIVDLVFAHSVYFTYFFTLVHLLLSAALLASLVRTSTSIYAVFKAEATFCKQLFLQSFALTSTNESVLEHFIQSFVRKLTMRRLS